VPGRKDDERYGTLRALLIPPPGRVVFGCLRPETLALIGAGFGGVYLDLVRPYLYLGAGRRAQVVDPPRVVRMAALGTSDYEFPVIRHIGQRRGPPFPAPGSNVVEQQQRWKTRDVLADPAARRAVQGHVNLHQTAQERPASIGKAQMLRHTHPNLTPSIVGLQMVAQKRFGGKGPEAPISLSSGYLVSQTFGASTKALSGT
jgi:hypothetical protein